MPDNDQFVLFEAPVITSPELRLYYDNNGIPICYSCEQLEGNFIVIDAKIYAEARLDIRVVDGKITKYVQGTIISKLIPDTEGILCEDEDVSIIAGGTGTYWKVKSYELK